jgi:antirestriction protein ArdC
MVRSTKPKVDPAQQITDELITLIEGGKLPWRKPWRGGAAQVPLRHNGEPYQGVNNFLLTLRSNMAGHNSPYWMTFNQAKTLGGKIIKGSKSSIVVHYGPSYKAATKASEDGADCRDEDDSVENVSTYRPSHMKSYRVFNADMIEGLDAKFSPTYDEDAPEHPPHQPIAHMQTFFDAIGGDVHVSGREAKYVPALDRIYIPEISLFERPEMHYAVLAHEYGHWTKQFGRLNRDYGHSRFGNTSYAREELVAELCAFLVGQHLGFAPTQLETTAAYLQGWLHVLRTDKRAIFTHMADAKAACDFLMAASVKGQSNLPSPTVAEAA